MFKHLICSLSSIVTKIRVYGDCKSSNSVFMSHSVPAFLQLGLYSHLYSDPRPTTCFNSSTKQDVYIVLLVILRSIYSVFIL